MTGDRTTTGHTETGRSETERKRSRRTLVAVGLLVALLLAGGASYYASNAPDGLNKVAADQGFDTDTDTAADGNGGNLADGPLAGYETDGVGNGRLSGGLAGVVGVLVTFALVGGLTLAVRRRGDG